MVKHFISPKYEYGYLGNLTNLDKKIDVFEDQMIGWYIGFAEKIKNLNNSEFAIMALTFHYFENIAKYQNGYTKTDKSGYYFIKGFKSVFPGMKNWGKDLRDNTLKLLWELGRCGLYHGSIFGNKITIYNDQSQIINIDKSDRPNPKARINTKTWPKLIQQHFKEYIDSIRDESNTIGRENFEKRFDIIILNKSSKI